MSTQEAGTTAFSKKQMLASTLFTPKHKDVLDVILQDDNRYTLDEAEQLLKLFLNEEVI
ncbi:hypothetical protein GCM10010912_59340 [Paenibacillus albidus]|uniref:Uncharacterized protein n=1 Tax=Paenibacillus albidus TaxID=2041023 RepID=A0A917D191_9BACL|nr:hypothetical protein [Paenibacillus albidus]GGG06788.1 hypothetical protein GCM10010912_59340 [Paenibacillus albidus]